MTNQQYKSAKENLKGQGKIRELIEMWENAEHIDRIIVLNAKGREVTIPSAFVSFDKLKLEVLNTLQTALANLKEQFNNL